MCEMQNDGAVHVSSVLLADDEALEHIGVEAEMHEGSGWTVTRLSERELVCAREGIVRRVWLVDEVRGA